MKRIQWWLAVCMVGTLALMGCSKDGSTSTETAATQTTVDTAPIEKNFSSADPDTKSAADKVVSAVKAGNYSEALTELKALAGNAKLTPEQQQAIKDVMAQVQNALTGAATKAQGEATKAVDDLKKALPK